MKDQNILLKMINHAFEYGQSSCTIGIIAKLHMNGRTPKYILEHLKKFDSDVSGLYLKKFKDDFCAE